MAKSEANWVNIDPSTLTVELREAYEAYKAAYRVTKAKRDTFQDAMQDAAGLPASQRLVFGYNFGKLSIAIVAAEAKVVSKAKPAQSLAAFLSTATADGVAN